MEIQQTKFRSISNADIEAKFLELHEDEFSKSILVPLFQSIYGCRVEFVGGRVEKGRDILIHKVDELGDPSNIAVQVKKVKWGENSSVNSIQTLLIQLSQASSEPIISISDGNESIANTFIVVTPHLIGQRVIDSHRVAFRTAVNGKNVTILDGVRVISLIKKHCPELLQKLYGHSLGIAENIYGKLNNVDLMKAMGVSNYREIRNIYCKSNFLFGGVHYEKFMQGRISSSSEIILNLSGYKVEQLIEVVKDVERDYSIDILVSPDMASIEDERLKASECSEWESDLRKEIKGLKSDVDSSEEVEKFYNSISVLLKDFDELTISLRSAAFLRKNEVSESISKKIKIIQAVSEKISDSKSEAEDVSFKIDLSEFIDFIECKKIELNDSCLDTVSGVEEHLGKIECLVDCFRIASFFDRNLDFITSEKSESVSDKVSLTKVFQTRKNISVLGDAGSGKTTNLKVYADEVVSQNRGQLIVFSTLSVICKCAVQQGSESILSGIVGYYRSCSIHLTPQEIELSLKNGGATIILDSVDEALSEYPWVIDSVMEFSTNYPKSQVVISSRFSISKINEIPFAHVSLLPFDRVQQKEFFCKWFQDDAESARDILEHLKVNPELKKIVVNPLSATILCVIKENGVTLPESETELYRQRFNLLAGKFDSFKDVQRLVTPSEKLVEAAQYIALEVHKLGKKEFSRGLLESLILSSLKSKDHSKVVEISKDLLLSEIILTEGGDNLSFGHLRFQEYLASREMLTTRDFKTEVLLKSPWWHDVLILFSKEARSVRWIFDYVIQNDDISACKDILDELISVRPQSEHEELKSLVRAAVVSDLELTEEGLGFSGSLDSLTHPMD